ncbi:spore germination protein [Paenibacillus sp. MZ04-78.2]|uniref:GerAB/ArcD/ProY family transporter n=1 Tax=Paenibacillus sp. MZ04-78.2 TaxID=2962034 RepID=UPI0020B696FF|nr:endospore germination permease [Paenibacillus sp. MZ04-78.2]MCP3772973.1 spore germination protein [Paenibacillus sp. MZ04-78.2]
MSVSGQEQISTSQTALSISSYIIAEGFIVMPRFAAMELGTPDVWLAMLLGGMICLIAGGVGAKLSQRFPGLTFFQYTGLIVGKPVGWLISLVMIAYFVGTAALELRIQAEVMNHYLLNQTPIQAMMIAFMAVGLYLVMGGVNPTVRLMELFLPITIIAIVIVFIVASKNVDLNNLRPVLSEGISPVIKVIKTTALPYSGFEIILLLTAFMNKPQNAVKAVAVGISIPLLLYVANAVVVIGTFGIDEVTTLTWPTMELARSIEFPGGFFENFEAIFFVVWVIEFFTTYVLPSYFASLGLSQLLNKKIVYFHFGLLPVIYWLAISPPDINAVFQLGDRVGMTAIFIAGVIPCVLFLIALARRRK